MILLMDYQIASKKLIFTVVTFSILYIVISLIWKNILLQQSVTFCSSGSQLVAVFRIEKDTTVLFPSTSTKDTLDCLRRGMSFYDRTVEYVITSRPSDRLLAELNNRYTVLYVGKMTNDNFSTVFTHYENKLIIQTDPVQFIYLKAISNPFTFVEEIQSNNVHIVLVPAFSEAISHLLENHNGLDGIRIIQLQEGDHVTLSL